MEWTFCVTGPALPKIDTEFFPLGLKKKHYDRQDVGWPEPDQLECGELANRAPCPPRWWKSLGPSDFSKYEHIAGHGCKAPAYLGSNIAIEELRGSYSFQCLAPKSDSWGPIADSLDFEQNSAYHLTGVGLFGREPFMVQFWPPRHGIETGTASVDLYGYSVRLWPSHCVLSNSLDGPPRASRRTATIPPGLLRNIPPSIPRYVW